MSTQKWIAFKDQQPGDDQFPVFYYFPSGAGGISMRYAPPTEGFATHWMSAKLPPPPAKEPSLAELDANALANFKYHEVFGSLTPVEHKLISAAWNSAIAYERARVKVQP